MSDVDLAVHESVLILDGGEDAALPDGSSDPILAGPEAIFINGRIDADAPTRIRMTRSPSAPGGFVEGFRGELATPLQIVRLVSVDGTVYATQPVRDTSTSVQIYLNDNTIEPDEVVIVLPPDDADA